MNFKSTATMLNCSNEYPRTEVLYRDLKENQYPDVIVALTICCILCVTMIVIYLEAVYFVFRFHSNTRQKIRIMFLLALCPIIAWTSLLAILVPTATLLSEFTASIYVGVCIVVFLNMLLEYLGGTTQLLTDMSDQTLTFGTPPCCCCCMCCKCCRFPFNKKTLRVASVFTIQIAIVRPIVLFVAAVLWTDGKYASGDEGEQSSITFPIQVFSGVSTILGVWGLQIVYRATRDRLTMFRVNLKFASFQLTFAIVNLQNFILAILGKNGIPACEGSRGPLMRGSRLNHYLLVIEMFLLCILSRFAYRRQEAKNIQEYSMDGVTSSIKDSSDKEVNGIDNFVDVATHYKRKCQVSKTIYSTFTIRTNASDVLQQDGYNK
ncbi:organic solute transporter subunit alpha-like isoform X1 [Mytilus edulis]|uniref:organic solute transporter subunit alpha-like isoform X1 n=3 Tax=Mytilus edulis TaxID=6550 RepID=UPI0039EEE4DC